MSSNGTFTFPSLLATGETYNVTVVTNPTSQQCAVSNGSGTVGTANVTNISVTCTTLASTVSDNFARANGSLGPNWTAMSDGPLAISSQMVMGTNAGGNSGDIRTAETYASDQYSPIQVTSTPLTGGQWIGPMVRVQGGGQRLYVGIYYWNNGSPELMLFKRLNGTWTQLGSTYSSGAPARRHPAHAHRRRQHPCLRRERRRSDHRHRQQPDRRGARHHGQRHRHRHQLDRWQRRLPGRLPEHRRQGIKSYDMLSDNNGYGAQTAAGPSAHPSRGRCGPQLPLRAPCRSRASATSFGDGLATLQALDAEDQYNLTIVEPSFYIQPWYANNPNDPNLQYETFMTNELVPWVKANLSTTGTEQNWLIGFSKSGYGGQDLILKHPNLFALAASWDFPADMSSYDQYSTYRRTTGPRRTSQPTTS